MFLHAGASLHGHEYSNKPSAQIPQPGGGHRRSPLRSSTTLITPPVTPDQQSTSNTIPSTSSSSSPSRPPFATPCSFSCSPASTSATSVGPPSTPSPVVRSSTVTNARRSSLRLRPHHRRASDSFPGARRRSVEPVVRFQEPVVAGEPTTTAAIAAAATTTTTTTTTATTATTATTMTMAMATPNRLVAFPPHPMSKKPLALDPTSEDESAYSVSEAGSFMSDQASAPTISPRSSRRRRSSRRTTAYLFAHPAPKLATKKQLLQRIRPTLLMQVQQVPLNSRPVPVIDVYPSSLIAGNVVAPRFSKRFPRIFGVRGELGIHDTILVRSDKYGSRDGDSDSEDDEFESRSLIAVLSPVRHEDRTEIVLEDGTVWVATPLPTGSFDFVHTAADGTTTTVRWVRRPLSKLPGAPPPLQVVPAPDGNGTTPCVESNCKFTFSIIDPQSRRHPVLASLTRFGLEIQDSYTTVSPMNERNAASRSRSSSIANSDSFDEDVACEKRTIPIEGALKSLITVTSVYLALRFCWAEAVARGGKPGGPCPIGGAAANLPSIPQRGVSGSFRRRRSPPSPDSNSEPDVSNYTTTNNNNNSNSGSNGSNGSNGNNGSYGNNVEACGRNLIASVKRPAAPSPLREDHLQVRSMSPAAELRNPQRVASFPPRKATSTGAAFVQRRKQLQASDLSDSEPRRSFTGPRRAITFSRLSGDFTRAVSRQQQSPSPSESATTAVASRVEVSPSPSTRRSASTRKSPETLAIISSPQTLSPSVAAATRAMRSQSAYYTTDPFTNVDTSSPAAPRAVDAAQPRRPASLSDKSGSRWKKLGNLFKFKKHVSH